MSEQPSSRDETAFSVDPDTGAPSAPGLVRDRASALMAALGDGRIDEAEYHRLLEDDDSYAEFLKTGDGEPAQAPTLADLAALALPPTGDDTISGGGAPVEATAETSTAPEF